MRLFIYSRDIDLIHNYNRMENCSCITKQLKIVASTTVRDLYLEITLGSLL